MVLILKGSQRREHAALFDKLFRLRHQIFVRGRGWSLPSMQGMEIDQYDTDNAYYFLDLNDDGTIEGSVRMTPTMQSSLLADYFPHLVENGLSPRDPSIYEATRYIVLPSRKTREGNRQAKLRLLTTLVEWCMNKNLSHLQAVVDSGTLSSFVEITPQTIPLGLSHPFGGGRGVPGGGDCVAFRWPITDQVLDDIRAYGGDGLAVPTLHEPRQEPAIASLH